MARGLGVGDGFFDVFGGAWRPAEDRWVDLIQ